LFVSRLFPADMVGKEAADDIDDIIYQGDLRAYSEQGGNRRIVYG